MHISDNYYIIEYLTKILISSVVIIKKEGRPYFRRVYDLFVMNVRVCLLGLIQWFVTGAALFGDGEAYAMNAACRFIMLDSFLSSTCCCERW